MHRPLLILTIIILLTFPTTTATHPTTIIYVDITNTTGPWDGTPQHPYQHITDAINNATDTDTIVINHGTYHEQITLTKQLTIQGQDKNTTILTADNKGTIITITTDHCTIHNLTVLNSAGLPHTAAIDIHANGTTLTHLNIYRNRIGIQLTNHTTLTIQDCMIHTNGQGIHTQHSTNIQIHNTYLYHNAIAILLHNTTATLIDTCYLHTNGAGTYALNSTNILIINSAYADNNDNQGGAFFRNSHHAHIINSLFTNQGVGIGIKNSDTINITHNTFDRNTHFATKLYNATNITITSNTYHNNLRNAIYAEHSTLTITYNDFTLDTNYGLYATTTHANATHNYWGSRLGPTHNSYATRADRASRPHGTITYYPWAPYPYNYPTTWNITTTFTNPEHPDTYHPTLTLPGSDTDGDGAPDWWETKWGYNPLVPEDHANLDPDGDGLTNLEECFTDAMGSNPYHKDVFLEFDYLASTTPNETNLPSQKYLDQMIAPYAEHNITLHIDTGNLGGGEELPSQRDLNYEDIVNCYWDHFLNCDLNNPRKGVFHYGLLCDYSEGGGFAVIGWDDLDTFTIACQQLQDKYTHFARGRLAVGASIHELGHHAGLIAARFGGIDNMAPTHLLEKGFWQYRHYQSCLNYCYTYFLMTYSDGSHGKNDFDDWGHLNFTFFKNTEFTLPS